ncbi:MAG: RNA methyltransferase [Phycisphaeraceae bacterium]
MSSPLRITSPDNPRVKAVVRLRDSRDRRATGLFIAEGFREVERALSARLRLVELYASPEILGFDLAELSRRLPWPKDAGDASVFEVSANVLKKMAYRSEPEGVIAVLEQPRWDLDSLRCEAGDFFLIGVGIEKPGNLGAMARTCAAAGAAALLAADAPIDPFNPNAIRASTGAVFTLPIISGTSDELIAWLAAKGIRILAATLAPDAKPHTQATMTGSCAIAIGAEDEGLPAAWIDAARASGGSAVTIAMHTRQVDSLNASVAAGVLLFEAVRQRAGG